MTLAAKPVLLPLPARRRGAAGTPAPVGKLKGCSGSRVRSNNRFPGALRQQPALSGKLQLLKIDRSVRGLAGIDAFQQRARELWSPASARIPSRRSC